MSNEINPSEGMGSIDNLTDDLRVDNFQTPPVTAPRSSFVKPVIHAEPSAAATEALSAQQVIDIAKLAEKAARDEIRKSRFDPKMPGQILAKENTPITDFSKLTDADVYDLSIPIEAKPFMSADVLHVKLKDTNYEARWVNKNPQNLGNKIAKGFTYIEPGDLIQKDGIKTGMDAEGHYCFDDVVAMKIDKATYYAALRAAHLRAVNTTDQSRSRERAAKAANSYMNNESGYSNDFQNAAVTKKMVFYDPGIEA